MEMQDTLKLVVQAVHETTNSHGPSTASAHVAGFLKSSESADPLDLFSIAGMRLGDFYSHSHQSLDRDELWEHILGLAGEHSTDYPPPPPPPIESDTTLGQIAAYLTTKVG